MNIVNSFYDRLTIVDIHFHFVDTEFIFPRLEPPENCHEPLGIHVDHLGHHWSTTYLVLYLILIISNFIIH